MRALLAAAFSAALLAGTIAPVAVAHDDGDGGYRPPALDVQEGAYEDVVAAKANPRSRAPKSFAPCIRGMAAGTYPCHRVDMMSHLSLRQLGLSFANDIWGWIDPVSRKEYAIIGGIEGTVFVDISDPKRPDVVGLLPTHSDEGGEFWRDIKVYADHAYIVAEQTGHGMQVFDLTRLRGVKGAPVTFTEDYDYAQFSSAHNLNINEDTGYAYVVGSDTCDGGLHMVDLSNPKEPTFAGCFSEHGYIHDTQCVVYQGPDVTHRGREMCVSSAATFLDFSAEGIINTISVVDVTDKSNPIPLDRYEYENDGYSHQGWLTPDQRFFVHNDELDEIFHGNSTTTRIFDMRDLDAISLLATTDNGNPAIGHNQYTEGDRVYASNYTSGLRIFDSRGIAAGMLPEIGYFDMYPENDDPTFEGGTWSNYPYYKSPIVAVSSMDRGLFVLRPRGNLS